MSTQGRGGCENKQLKNMSGLLFHNVFIHFNIQPGVEELHMVSAKMSFFFCYSIGYGMVNLQCHNK